MNKKDAQQREHSNQALRGESLQPQTDPSLVPLAHGVPVPSRNEDPEPGRSVVDVHGNRIVIDAKNTVGSLTPNALPTPTTNTARTQQLSENNNGNNTGQGGSEQDLKKHILWALVIVIGLVIVAVVVVFVTGIINGSSDSASIQSHPNESFPVDETDETAVATEPSEPPTTNSISSSRIVSPMTMDALTLTPWREQRKRAIDEDESPHLSLCARAFWCSSTTNATANRVLKLTTSRKSLNCTSVHNW